ncbi:unnamed protein product [Enterobius vermicularis]|uniref:ANTH domain-containing protein n=1 Tax=Enterobius vermicularis TaxID=51028 RepID=A0A0N4VHD6_ENTVE|nr:unnamed protein product [Enterobius vermicularis]
MSSRNSFENSQGTLIFSVLECSLIRDGHSTVVKETQHYKPRILQLQNCWQALRSSTYCTPNSTYCKLLVNRLEFLERNSVFPGSLRLTDAQLDALMGNDIDQLLEICSDVLAQLENLMQLQATVFYAVGVLEWNSLTAQGQCLLAPLVLVIVDVSVLYRYYFKFMFKLRERLSSDVFKGSCDKFIEIYAKIKTFFDTASKLQYFENLVTIPTLPEQLPDFQKASDLKLQIIEAVEICNSSAENNSLVEEDFTTKKPLIILSEPSSSSYSQLPLQNERDPKDYQIEALRHDLEDAQHEKERVMDEAQLRIEQYEETVSQLKNENELYKQSLNELKKENDALRAAKSFNKGHSIDERRLSEAQRRENEKKLAKLQSDHARLNQKHKEAQLRIEQYEETVSQLKNENKLYKQSLNELKVCRHCLPYQMDLAANVSAKKHAPVHQKNKKY